MSYAIWHQPEYGAGLRSPDRPEDRHTRTRPPRRPLGRRLRALAGKVVDRG